MEKIKYELTHKYISDDLQLCGNIRKFLNENNNILLISPQNTGKTTFFSSFGRNCLFISPSRVLANQINKNSSYSYDKYNDFEPIANTYILGMQFLIDNPDTTVVVFDEVHKVVQYSGFAYLQVNAFFTICEYCKAHSIKMIFCTATPNILRCLGERFYKDVDIQITISCERQYVNNVFVQSKQPDVDEFVDLLINNFESGRLQVALYNDSELIVKALMKLENMGFKVKAISSKTRKSEENIEIVKKIQNAEEIDLDILLVTSWIDVGVNIVNTNIDHVYYFIDEGYNRGDITTLQQFVARFRNCRPTIHMNKPILTKQDNKLISYLENECKIYLLYDFQKLMNTKSLEYLTLKSIIEKTAYEAIHKFDSGLYCAKTIKTIDGIVLDEYEFIVSEIRIEYLIHILYEKLKLNNNIQSLREYLVCNRIEEFELSDSPLGNINLQKLQLVLEYLTLCANAGIEFRTQKILKDEISRIIGHRYNGNLKALLAFYEKSLGIELITRKSNGYLIYKLVYSTKNELPSYVEKDIFNSCQRLINTDEERSACYF